MPESFAGPLTLFDAAALAVVFISALMAVSRGFMRELATLGAFVAAVAASFFANRQFGSTIAQMLPDTLPNISASILIVGVVFLLVYVFAAWGGQRLSQSVNGPEGLGIIDRLAGMVFGVARGLLVLIFFVMLINMTLKPEQIPSQIADAKLYPALNSAAEYISSNAPRIAENVEVVLPEGEQQAN